MKYLSRQQLQKFYSHSEGNESNFQYFVKQSGKFILKSTLDELGIPFSESLSSYIIDPAASTNMGGGRNSAGRKPKPVKRRKVVRKKRLPLSLRGYTIPFHKVYLWSDMSGGKGVWYKFITINSLVTEYLKTFDEFKVKSLRVTYLPNNNTSATGIYSSVLLDQGGFGTATSGTEKGWFKTLASMPGARVTHRNQNNTYFWRPTEANANNWYRPQTDTDYNVCSLYFADNGQESVELGGVLKISGHLLGRGMFWDAPTVQRQRHFINQFHRDRASDDIASSFEQLGG